ncbi:hypothetical protein A6R68_15731 [Neotoma lepida]|uniref:Tumor necrosis factor alpha-induced protein 8-like protein 1 n=1 Tax=Neotoma lepida TaxID=56216 RepID=A0A1A6H5Y9_NEOLE|nr:hypothetical protein A6R68_15731 [Neotoma lepida]
MVVMFIKNTSSEILDELYQATKESTHSWKEAQRVVENLVKVVVKLAMQLQIHHWMHSLAMMTLNLQQVDSTSNRYMLAAELQEAGPESPGNQPQLTARSH